MLSGAVLSMCTFKCSIMSVSEWLFQLGEGHMFIQEIYFCSILFVQSVSETTYLSAEPLLLLEDMALTQVTAWITQHLRSHMPTEIYCKCKDVKNMYIWYSQKHT